MLACSHICKDISSLYVKFKGGHKKAHSIVKALHLQQANPFVIPHLHSVVSVKIFLSFSNS